MDSTNYLITALSCLFFMLLVASISYHKAKDDVRTSDGYFLASRGLGGIFIAGSMLLTNLSSEQLIGLNGSAYGFNLSSMAWEVTAAASTICMAFIFLPRYLAGAFTTLPEFLSNRFDDDVRRMTVILFMVGYGLVTIPSVLYSGSIAVLLLFDLPTVLNINYSQALVLTIVMIGSVGALYAIFGGLKAVVVSDTLNGLGLLIIGILVPILGFSVLGSGNIYDGLKLVATTKTYKLNAIGSANDPTPFGTIFTGMVFANLFYWCTNQYVIQRTLSAKNLAEGQKGVLISGFFKVLVPFMMMIPGLIAFHLYGPGLGSIDQAYPKLISDVLPNYLAGFFLAVLLGAVFSSFNSLLNSAATLFCFDIYLPSRKGDIDDDTLLRIAKRASIVIALFSFLIAPLLQYAPDGLWQIIRIFTGFYNIPVIVLVIVGLFTKRVPALAAKVVIISHIILYGLFQFVFNDIFQIHFLHLYAILFIIESMIMLLIGYFKPLPKPWEYTNNAVVDLAPWRFLIPVSIHLFSAIIFLYLIFSPIGLVGGLSNMFWVLVALLLLVNISIWFVKIPKILTGQST